MDAVAVDNAETCIEGLMAVMVRRNFTHGSLIMDKIGRIYADLYSSTVDIY